MKWRTTRKAALRTYALGATVLGAALACAPTAAAPMVPGDPAESASRPAAGPLPPGFGTLHQDDFTLSIRAEPLLIKVTPLAEEVILLAAPDTYDRLHAIAASRRAEAAAAARVPEPALFLVSLLSGQPDARFQPDDLHLLNRGRLLRPRAILPITPEWGRLTASQHEPQSAIYVFDPEIDLELPLVVRYGARESNDWMRILDRLRDERAKVRARSGAGLTPVSRTP